MEDDDDQPLASGPLSHGGLYRLDPSGITLTDALGRVTVHGRLDEMTAVRRGGTDIVITRVRGDPIMLTLRRVEDARQVVAALERLLMSEPRKPRRRWRRG